MKKKVGGYEQDFELDHAQRLLDHQKQNPPASWVLSDVNFTIEGGKLKPIEKDGDSDSGSSVEEDS